MLAALLKMSHRAMSTAELPRVSTPAQIPHHVFVTRLNSQRVFPQQFGRYPLMEIGLPRLHTHERFTQTNQAFAGM